MTAPRLHVQQVGAKKLWSVHASLAFEPFAYIGEVAGVFQVEDVEDGSLGSRRTLEDAVALLERYAAASNADVAAHTARVLAILASELPEDEVND